MKNAADPMNDPVDFPVSRDKRGMPPHTIRRSKRARRIGLRVLPGKGLEVVLPLHADPACVPDILSKYDSWIRRALERIRGGSHDSSGSGDAPVHALPDFFLIKGGEELVALFPGAESSALSRLTRPPLVRRARLFPEGYRERPDFSQAVALGRLREWVREEAREYLGNMLTHLAAVHGFSYKNLSIRFQKTRWGSCSARGNINLNGCLLFLPEALTRYILLHELCHTRQLNHSDRFWKILFSIEPEALALDKAMRRAWRYVPQWTFAE